MKKANMHSLIAVVPAAGIGSRMQSECPKQYLKINHKTILEYTVEALFAHSAIEKIVIVLNRDDTIFHSLPIANDPRIITTIGGASRAESVWAGLQQVPECYHWVLVHDAARPCLQLSDLNALIEQVLPSEVGGILAAPVSDTIKQAIIEVNQISHTVDRRFLWRALTPQMFPVELLKFCLQRAIDENVTITDEASALEHCGFHPLLISGRTDNIKVTHPEDLALATFYLKNKE